MPEDRSARIADPGKGPPALPEGLVHLWSAELDLSRGWAGEGQKVLSAEERDRAGSFRFDRHKERYVAGRFILRSLLSVYTGVSPQEIALDAREDGKPFLCLDGRASELRFNQSDSQGRTLVALARSREIGVDLERVDPRVEVRELAKVALSGEEMEGLRSLDEEAARERFYTLWTVKEAFLKGVGTGLRTAPNQIVVDLSRGSIRVTARSGPPAQGWSFLTLEPWEGFKAALALQGPLDGIVRQRFEDYQKLS